MKNKYLYLLAAVVALLLPSCARDGEWLPGESSLQAALDCSASATKAVLVDNPGIRMETFWQAGDRIGVFGEGASNVLFSVGAGDIAGDGRTAAFKSPSQIPSGRLLSYSPYSPDAILSGESVSLTFPAVQTYTLVNGVPAPDASCSLMMGSGSAAGGVTFRNAMAVLKIGQVFDTDVVVKQVEFRGLAGEPVCGRVDLSWNDGAPLAVVTGSGKVITLDCGAGISLCRDQLGVFYLMVPAGNYSRGFEITFICESGRIVRTVGTTKGKTLDRSIVYLIGDVSANEPLPGSTSTLKSTAILMTPDNLDMIQIYSTFNTSVLDGDNRPVSRPDGTTVFMPRYSMFVHKDLQPAVGKWMVFSEPTDDLPAGGVYIIKTCEKTNDGDYYEVTAWPEPNPAAPFESLTVGTETDGVPLDLSSYISSIVDEQGNNVPFQLGAGGEILLDEETVAGMLGLETKAGYHSHRFTSPRIGLTRKEPSKGLEFFVGGSIALNTKLALGFMQGECQYAVLKVEPEMEVSLNAALKAEGTIEANCNVYTVHFIGIQVAPGVIVVPKLVISARAGVGGTIQISGTVSLTQKLGSYSIAYNKGDGMTMRGGMDNAFDTPEVKMEFGGLEGSLFVYGGLGVNTFLSFYGMAGLGLYNDFTLKFGVAANSDGGVKLALTPEYEATPAVTTLFGSKKFEDATAKVEFEPLWERYIRPKSPTADIKVQFNMSDPMDVPVAGLADFSGLRIAQGVQGINYKIALEGKCVQDMDVVLAVYSGSGIGYRRLTSADEAELAAFRADGVEHLFSSTHICDRYLLNPGEQPVATIPLGVYPAETDAMTFEGTASYAFSSGQAYGVVPAVKIDDALHVLDYGSTTNLYNSFIYWWPNRSNGAPYFLGWPQ